MKRPNVLFLVLDCLRRDAVDDYASNLRSLADANLRFENAVAPAHWSLPAHVSLFSGEYPSAHSTYHLDSTVDELSALAALRSEGYDTYGVSANPFVNESFGFDEYFDEFHSTVPDDWFEYAPERNTDCIEGILEAEAGDDDPFFLFANYMDAHHPYNPPETIRERELDESYDHETIAALNDDHDPVSFMKRVADGSVDAEALARIRDLYGCEVRTLDRQLGALFDVLEDLGLREETLVVLTADHGENLGEKDGRGERRIGHTESTSDHLLRVPLVVVHPDLDAREVSREVEMKNVASLFRDAPALTPSSDEVVETLGTDEGVAVAECPADGGKNHIDESEYADLPETYLERLSSTHTTVGYAGDWKVVATSSNDRQAWQDGESRDVEAAPPELVRRVEARLDELSALDATESGREVALNDETKSRLEDLGYL